MRWVSGRSTEMYDADGALTGFAGGALDVTARHVAEQDRRMRAQITAHMSEGVVLVRHSDNQIVFTNSRFDELFGYDEGQMLGMDATRLNADGRRDGDSTVRQILGAVERHGAWRGEIHNVRRNGTRFWSWANVSAFEHPEHGMVSLSIQSDVTERKRVDDELRNERRLLAEAQAIGHVGSWEIKLSDASATWSEEMVRLHGMTPGSRPPRRYLALVHPDDRDEGPGQGRGGGRPPGRVRDRVSDRGSGRPRADGPGARRAGRRRHPPAGGHGPRRDLGPRGRAGAARGRGALPQRVRRRADRDGADQPRRHLP